MNFKKIKIALVFLLIALVLLISSSLAWLTLSFAPEIVGVETNVGANGSLEIALLSNDTHADLSLIRAKVGASAVRQDTTVSNLSWGNVIELNDSSYGLGEITLKPARLKVYPELDGSYSVRSNLLSIAAYGFDGRAKGYSDDVVSAIYDGSNFAYDTTIQTYGVRGVGTIPNLPSQQEALAVARAQVKSSFSAARTQAGKNWDAEVLKAMQNSGSPEWRLQQVSELQSGIAQVTSHIHTALQQTAVAYAAANIADEAVFRDARQQLENKFAVLSESMAAVPMEYPQAFVDLVAGVEQIRTHNEELGVLCGEYQDALQEGGKVTDAQIQALLKQLLDPAHLYLGNTPVAQLNSLEKFQEDCQITMSDGAGLTAALVPFVGNYTAISEYEYAANKHSGIELMTTAEVKVPYMQGMIYAVDEMDPAMKNFTGLTMQDTYGFAVDAAFRCNAENASLLLQTDAAERIEGQSEPPETQGSGSYIRLRSQELDTERLVLLMDALRVGFLDQQGTLLAVAKLNTTNYTADREGASAPLYLYDYTVEENGKIAMGERLEKNSAITTLQRNNPTCITTVVWLDGDYVENRHAAHAEERIDGVLNLQFASSADLVVLDQKIRG